MNALIRGLARRIFPRKVRNWLRTPGKAIAWRLNEVRRPVTLTLRPGWTVKCPRNAAHAGYNAVLSDPPQVVECDDFIQLLRAQARVLLLDIGCHFGVFSLAAIHYGGASGRVVAIDPSSDAEHMFTRLMALNGCENQVKFHRAAVGAEPGELDMVEAGIIADGYLVLPKDHPPSDITRVQVTTIDKLVADTGERPTVIKIDVESYELQVLQGGRHTLSTGPIPLCLELHNRMMRERGVEPGLVLSELDRHGYSEFVSAGRRLTKSDLLRADLIRCVATGP